MRDRRSTECSLCPDFPCHRYVAHHRSGYASLIPLLGSGDPGGASASRTPNRGGATVAFRGKHRRHNRIRTLAVAGAATAMAAGLMAPVANAWDNDPHVTVKGGAGCKQLLHKVAFVQFSLENGEFAQSTLVQGYYKVDFYNIPGSTVTNSGTLNGVGGYA